MFQLFHQNCIKFSAPRGPKVVWSEGNLCIYIGDLYQTVAVGKAVTLLFKSKVLNLSLHCVIWNFLQFVFPRLIFFSYSELKLFLILIGVFHEKRKFKFNWLLFSSSQSVVRKILQMVSQNRNGFELFKKVPQVKNWCPFCFCIISKLMQMSTPHYLQNF